MEFELIKLSDSSNYRVPEAVAKEFNRLRADAGEDLDKDKEKKDNEMEKENKEKKKDKMKKKKDMDKEQEEEEKKDAEEKDKEKKAEPSSDSGHEIDRLKAKCDAQSDLIKKLKGNEKIKQDNLNIKTRVKLIVDAGNILKSDVKDLTLLDDMDIKKEVIKKVLGRKDESFQGKTDSYIDATYEVALENLSKNYTGLLDAATGAAEGVGGHKSQKGMNAKIMGSDSRTESWKKDYGNYMGNNSNKENKENK